MVVWLDINEALERNDVPDLTKKLIACAVSENKGLNKLPYESYSKHGQGILYGIE